MSEERLEGFMKAWLEAESAELPNAPPGRTPSCLTFHEAFEAAEHGADHALDADKQAHVRQCEYCEGLLGLFNSVLAEPPPGEDPVTAEAEMEMQEVAGAMAEESVPAEEEPERVTPGPRSVRTLRGLGLGADDLGRRLMMAAGETWETVSEALVRLAEPLEVFMPSQGGLATEPAGTLGAAVLGPEPEYPDQVQATVTLPETNTTIELVFGRAGALEEVDLRGRESRAVTVDERTGWQLKFVRDTGEEVRAAWLEPGEEVTIPRVEGGSFVLSLLDEDRGTAYEIPIVIA